MRKFLIASLLLLFAFPLFAQTSSLQGLVKDTLEKKLLANAVVTLLQKKDSALYKFARSNQAGIFQLNDVKPGSYVLLITYPKFADYVDEINVPSQPVNLGTIPLTLKSELLQAVIIKNTSAIRIKGDTTEFAADSFQVKEGATVEDLLKKIPGFQVNSKGEITAQGQRVQKVLVDGEEFFGDDPTVATKNISAKAVDKVQVFDTKSEQENLKGLSSSTEGKTVNIKLKEEAKKGAFGKVYAGMSPDHLVDAKLLYNRFRGKQKFSVYGTKSDISTGTLDWEDQQKLGIEDDVEYDEISGYYYSFGSNDEFNNWNLRGLPKSYSAGTLYSNKWDEDKKNLNASYRYNRLGAVNASSTRTQNILSSGTTYQNRFQNTSGVNQQHAGNLKYEWKLDSLTSFKYTGASIYKTNDAANQTYSEYLDSNKAFVNQSRQALLNHIEKKQLDNQLTYKQLFKKKDRLLLATLRYSVINDWQNGTIQTNTAFYRNNMVDSLDVADQQKMRNGQSKTFGTKLTWSEPLNAKWNLILDYGYNVNNSISDRNTFNKDFNGKYTVLDSVFSNRFELKAASNNTSATMRYIGKKLRGALGLGVSTVQLNLFNVDSNRTSVYRFTNLTPQANATYSLKPQSRLSLSYRGSTRQPTIDQLQPIRDNADRLSVFVGNPNLKVGFTHSMQVSYNSSKTLSQRYFYLSFVYSIPVNAIGNYTYLDVTRGKQIATPININGNRNWNTYAYWSKQSAPGKLSYSFNMSSNGGTNHNFISEMVNNIATPKNYKTDYANINLYAAVLLQKEDKYEFSLRPTIGYNRSKSTVKTLQNPSYWNYGGNAVVRYDLPAKFEILSECNFDLRQQYSFGTNPNQIKWNAELSKKILKDNAGRIYLIANDILNQSKGFSRSISSNVISENQYSLISQYFLLKFEWSFTKKPGEGLKQ